MFLVPYVDIWYIYIHHHCLLLLLIHPTGWLRHHPFSVDLEDPCMCCLFILCYLTVLYFWPCNLQLVLISCVLRGALDIILHQTVMCWIVSRASSTICFCCCWSAAKCQCLCGYEYYLCAVFTATPSVCQRVWLYTFTHFLNLRIYWIPNETFPCTNNNLSKTFSVHLEMPKGCIIHAKPLSSIASILYAVPSNSSHICWFMTDLHKVIIPLNKFNCEEWWERMGQ